MSDILHLHLELIWKWKVFLLLVQQWVVAVNVLYLLFDQFFQESNFTTPLPIVWYRSTPDRLACSLNRSCEASVCLCFHWLMWALSSSVCVCVSSSHQIKSQDFIILYFSKMETNNLNCLITAVTSPGLFLNRLLFFFLSAQVVLMIRLLLNT